MSGGHGDDLLVSGGSDDVLTGGNGGDVFDVSGITGNAVIKDFSFAEGDQIIFTAWNWQTPAPWANIEFIGEDVKINSPDGNIEIMVLGLHSQENLENWDDGALSWINCDEINNDICWAP